MSDIDPKANEPTATAARPLERGIGLCLSGGGFRAMLFHVGSLWRLNEAGMLPELSRCASVSGGSITNAVLAKAWPDLAFDSSGVAAKYGDLVVDPLRRFAGHSVDVWAGVTGLFIPGRIGRRVAVSYDHHLFHAMTLGDLPASGAGPRFTFCATDMGSGHLWYHERGRLGEYQSGFLDRPKYPVAMAVAASSAFPPFLAPILVDLSAYGPLDAGHPARYRLADGGVYDNLGLQPVEGKYEIVLASDAGAPFVATAKPPLDWFRQLLHTTEVIDTQVRRLRREHFVGSLVGEAHGAFWGIGTDIADYVKDSTGLPFDDPMDAPATKTKVLAATPTRLGKLPAVTQERLINWGYAVTDAALRRHVRPLPKGTFPYPKVGVG